MFKDCIQAYIHTMYTIKTLESLLPNMSFIICAYSRDTNLKLQYFGHLMQSGLTGKDPDAGRDWGQEEKGATEDEIVGWYHGLNGHEFEQTMGDGEGQRSLVCCSPWGHKESDTT